MILNWMMDKLEGFIVTHNKKRRSKTKKRNKSRKPPAARQKKNPRNTQYAIRNTKKHKSPVIKNKVKVKNFSSKAAVPQKKITQKPVREVKKNLLKIKPANQLKIKPAAVRAAKKTPVKKIRGERIGTVSHYFTKIQVCVVNIEKSLNVGDTIEVRRGNENLGKEKIQSMQINHIPIEQARKGEEIGMKMKAQAKSGDTIYKI
jgi:hypothetical protein